MGRILMRIGWWVRARAGELALLSGLPPIQHGRNVLMLREQACCQAGCEGVVSDSSTSL